MSWTDKLAVKTILQLRDDFNIEEFIETGTFKGINAYLYSLYFKRVFTCEIDPVYYKDVKDNCNSNVVPFNLSSPDFLKVYKRLRKLSKSKSNIPLFYLDAHFYDPSLPKEKRFVVLDELEALKNLGDCVIVIHDFDCEGLGHITYDGISLNFNLVKEKLNKINPDFVYYTNTKEYCDIVTENEVRQGRVPGILPVEDVFNNLKYVWSSPEKTYRGILYCVPKELDLLKYKLKKLEIR